MKYYTDFFDINLKNIRKTWKGINSLLAKNKSSTKPILSLKDPKRNNKIIKDQSQFPNILNEHFSTIGNKLANKPDRHQNNPFLIF